MDTGMFYRRELVRLMRETNMLTERDNRNDYDVDYLRARLTPVTAVRYRNLMLTMRLWVSPSYHPILRAELDTGSAKLADLLDAAEMVFGRDGALSTLYCNAGAMSFAMQRFEAAREFYNTALQILGEFKPGDDNATIEVREMLMYCTSSVGAAATVRV